MAAIYMWFDEELQIWTTTLYPVEVVDNVRVNADIYSGALRPLPEENSSNSADLLAITNPQILISYGPDEESTQNSADVVGITNPKILISYGPDEESSQNSGDLLTVTKPTKLVTVDTPDEELRVVADVYPSACSMTAV